MKQIEDRGSGVPTLLIVEQDEVAISAYRSRLSGLEMQLLWVSSATAAIAVLGERGVDGILLSAGLTDRLGCALFAAARALENSPAIIVTAVDASLTAAIDFIRNGAYDYLVRPVSPARLVSSIESALAARRGRGRARRATDNTVSEAPRASGARQPSRLSAANEALLASSRPDAPRGANTGAAHADFCGFVGCSAPMQEVYRTISAAATSSASVLIAGESGTGKEVAAEALHQLSPRRDKAFVAINCAAIPRDLLESMLFGHVKGAFTGALADQEGAAALADGGTLFLDEIGEMDYQLQAKILRFTQTGTYQRVGDGRVRRADIRFVSATNRDPQEAVRLKLMREDLYYRLSVIPIQMPPLRERGPDILRIANRFLARFSALEGRSLETFSPSAAALLASGDWPGNVRQLENVVRNAVVMGSGKCVTSEVLNLAGLHRARALPALPSASAAEHRSPPHLLPTSAEGRDDAIESLACMEQRHIESAISRCGGNIQLAAKLLQISPSTIYRKKEAWEPRRHGAETASAADALADAAWSDPAFAGKRPARHAIRGDYLAMAS